VKKWPSSEEKVSTTQVLLWVANYFMFSECTLQTASVPCVKDAQEMEESSDKSSSTGSVKEIVSGYYKAAETITKSFFPIPYNSLSQPLPRSHHVLPQNL